MTSRRTTPRARPRPGTRSISVICLNGYAAASMNGRRSAWKPPRKTTRTNGAGPGGFRREVQPRRQHWFLNEKSGFPSRTPAFCSVSRGQRRLGEKEYRAPSVTPGVALRPRTQGASRKDSWATAAEPVNLRHNALRPHHRLAHKRHDFSQFKSDRDVRRGPEPDRVGVLARVGLSEPARLHEPGHLGGHVEHARTGRWKRRHGRLSKSSRIFRPFDVSLQA